MRTNAKALSEVFGAMARSRIALEIGTHSPWISRLLSELGHEVIVANARKVRLIGESRKKDDRLDAQTLARLARIDPELLYPVKHRSAQAQADLMMIRARAGLVRARTGLVNTARGLAKSYGERLRGCNVRNMNPEKAEGLSPELQRALEPLLATIEELSERIVEYNDRIEALAQTSYPQVALLKQIKGVGTLIALSRRYAHGPRRRQPIITGDARRRGNWTKCSGWRRNAWSARTGWCATRPPAAATGTAEPSPRCRRRAGCRCGKTKPGKWRFTIAIRSAVPRIKAASKPLSEGRGAAPSPAPPSPKPKSCIPAPDHPWRRNRYQQMKTPIFSAAW